MQTIRERNSLSHTNTCTRTQTQTHTRALSLSGRERRARVCGVCVVLCVCVCVCDCVCVCVHTFAFSPALHLCRAYTCADFRPIYTPAYVYSIETPAYSRALLHLSRAYTCVLSSSTDLVEHTPAHFRLHIHLHSLLLNYREAQTHRMP